MAFHCKCVLLSMVVLAWRVQDTYSRCYFLNTTTTKTNLESDLRKYFGDVRHPIVTGYKEATADFIRSVYKHVTVKNSQFEVRETSFQVSNFDGTFSTTFTNILGILKGNTYGSPADRILLLAAHYDTMPGTPGVDDNGSGTAALLEVLRLMADCRPQYTIMFVAFDAEEYLDSEQFNRGSRKFVDEYLIPNVLQATPGIKFQGAYILDTIMNYQTTPNSQAISLLEDAAGLVPQFQAPIDAVNARGKRGDFISTVGRDGVDNDLYQAFFDNYGPGSNNIVHVGLPFSDWSTLQQFTMLLLSDHKIFWSKESGDLPNGQSHLPALFITDSAMFRSRCEAGRQPVCASSCYHMACDSLGNNINDDNLQFLADTTETLVKALCQLAICTDEGRCDKP